MGEQYGWENSGEWPESRCAACGTALAGRDSAAAKVYAPGQPWIVLDLCLPCGNEAAAAMRRWLQQRSRARDQHAA